VNLKNGPFFRFALNWSFSAEELSVFARAVELNDI
jgi:hypothetical protein